MIYNDLANIIYGIDTQIMDARNKLADCYYHNWFYIVVYADSAINNIYSIHNSECSCPDSVSYNT